MYNFKSFLDCFMKWAFCVQGVDHTPRPNTKTRSFLHCARCQWDKLCISFDFRLL